jgi:hypothetical protein
MNGLLDRLPVEIVLAILEHVPKNSLLGLSLTCCLLNYLSMLVLLEHCGIRDPTNCTFDLYATEGQADALSALQAGLHIQWMKFLQCNLRPPGYYPQWDWPPAKLIHRLHHLMLRLISFDEVVLSFNMRGMIAPHDTYLISGVIILQNLLNTVITKCKILRIRNTDQVFLDKVTYSIHWIVVPVSHRDSGDSSTTMIHQTGSIGGTLIREIVHSLLALLQLCNRLRLAGWKLMP